MICPYCGKENSDNVRVCEYCGGILFEGENQNPSDASPLEPVTQLEIPTAEPASDSELPAAQPAPSPAGPEIVGEQIAIQPEIIPSEQFQPPEIAPKRGRGKWIWWFVGCLVLICLLMGCVAVFWGLYSYTSSLNFLHPTTSSPDTVQDTTNLLFSDDFSDPNSGWDRVNETDYSADYVNNAYRILVNKEMMDIWANPDDLSFGDVSIEVDATKNGGPDDNDFGAICRYQDVDHFYYGIVSSDGYFGIIKTTSDGSETLGRDSLDYSDLIHKGFATNHIRFDCIGDVLTLYVDGVQLDQQIDDEYTYGNVGLTAGTYKTPATDVLYDNFIVSQP
jgi:zinc-ribbon domain